MYNFSKRSLDNLSTCHPDLQILFKEVIKHIDCIVICGHRNEREQTEAYKNKKSQLKWPNSKHNTTPSFAADVIPYPVCWNNLNRFYFFAGVVLGISERLFEERLITHRIKFGGDWNKNYKINDESFLDLAHFQLIPAHES